MVPLLNRPGGVCGCICPGKWGIKGLPPVQYTSLVGGKGFFLGGGWGVPDLVSTAVAARQPAAGRYPGHIYPYTLERCIDCCPGALDTRPWIVYIEGIGEPLFSRGDTQMTRLYIIKFFDLEFPFNSHTRALSFGRWLRSLINRDGVVRLIHRSF